MRVKEVAVQGFKSFANRHQFIFPTGISAIVGPNGSGKSNVADAIRWVLGEQRASNIRARRTDDIIFAGTERRSRSGMAQVSVTFDNEDGWLEIDYPEVVIARRAEREGGSQFLINGSPVRLRDVLDLLGSRLGEGNYSVIGQGMVDSALTLRPEDRRQLIDEAAGLVPLQRRRDRSLRQLAETDENLCRVRDILEETGPRLRRMARLAERATKHEALAIRLRAVLDHWYGYHWHQAIAERERAGLVVGQLRSELESSSAALEKADARLREVSEAMARAESELASLRSAREALLARDAAARQAAAVGRARLDGLEARSRELIEASTAEEDNLSRLQRQLDERQAEVTALEAEHRAKSEDLTATRERLQLAETERERRASEAEARRARLFQIQAEQDALVRRIVDLETELATRQSEAGRLRDSERTAAEQMETAQVALTAASAAHSAAQTAMVEAGERLAAAERNQELRSAELGQARDDSLALRADLESLRARSDALDALFGEMDEASQLLLRIAASPEASVEVLGTVAQLLEVDPEWEAAAAAALGHRVQGIVLEHADHLDSALSLLLSESRGQFVLVALDAIMDEPAGAAFSGARPAAAIMRAPRAPGLVDGLFRRTAFVEDRDAARRILEQAGPDGPDRSASRDGILFERGTILTAGGSAGRVLEVERERRLLPEAIAQATEAHAAALQRVEDLTAGRREQEGILGGLTAARAIVAAERDETAQRLESARAKSERAAAELDWMRERGLRLTAELAATSQQLEAARNALGENEPTIRALSTEVESSEAVSRSSELDQLRSNLAEASATSAAVAQRLAGRSAMRDAARRELERAQGLIAESRTRAEQVAQERSALASEVDRLAGDAGSQHAELAALDAKVGPAEAALSDCRRSVQEHSADLDAARRSRSEVESRMADARVTASRAEDRQERLFDQLRSDSEWMELELEGQLELGASQDLKIPRVEQLSEDATNELEGLRRQMRAIGAIDRDALEAYEETAERHTHLTEQQADLVKAESDLRQLLASLESQMQVRFQATFDAVSLAFSRFFPLLFGGGDAELLIEARDGDAGGGGLEIMARPPGKRRQPLGLLSGGERALTAVALIFSLLEVSQTPFVVLDEVDAALDEANVERFCAALRSLAEHTQVVVITHNRGTIETAGTVYGVTMAEDGASQIISLRVDAAA